MRTRIVHACALAATVILIAGPAASQISGRTNGPATVYLSGASAQISIPQGAVFLDALESEQVFPPESLAFFRNSGSVVGSVLPLDENAGWSICLVVRPCGHVSLRDAEAQALADRNMEGLTEGLRAASKRNGYALGADASVRVIEPLSFSRTRTCVDSTIELSLEGAKMIQHQRHVFGRSEALVCAMQSSSEEYQRAAGITKKTMDSAEFLPGFRYTDFVSGQEQEGGLDLHSYMFGKSNSADPYLWKVAACAAGAWLLLTSVFLGLDAAFAKMANALNRR